MLRKAVILLLSTYALGMLALACAFVVNTLVGSRTTELFNSTPAEANRLTFGGIRVPDGADGVYVNRGYHPPRLFLRFHADRKTIDAWIAERLGTKSFREMPIPRGDDSMGLDWFDPHNIKTGKAFVEDAAAGGEQIFVDDERTLVIFHN